MKIENYNKYCPTGISLDRYLVDENGTLIARWMDNGLVLLVPTLHSVGASTQIERRRPCITQKNMQHVEKVWGELHKKKIFIPFLVHHYNQCMDLVAKVSALTTFDTPRIPPTPILPTAYPTAPSQ
eukprot:3508615-Ditylum_brightwellii.AAC.1